MEKAEIENPPFAKIDHLGIMVRDLDEAVEYYQSLGIGPFELREMSTLAEVKIYGKPVKFNAKIAVARVGSINIEVVQPMENAVLQHEFLESKGEGINHIGFLVDDLEKEKAKLLDKGLEVILSASRTTGMGAAYFDTRQVGGVLIELIKR